MYDLGVFVLKSITLRAQAFAARQDSAHEGNVWTTVMLSGNIAFVQHMIWYGFGCCEWQQVQIRRQ